MTDVIAERARKIGGTTIRSISDIAGRQRILDNNAETKGNAELQTREIMARAERTMKLAGFGWTDVVDGIVYINDGDWVESCTALVEDFAHTHEAVATIIGRSRPAVSNLLRLLELPEVVQLMVGG